MADQPSLFGEPQASDTSPPVSHTVSRRASPHSPGPSPAAVPADVQSLAHALHERWGDRLHLGTSSWHFPGWAGLVYGRAVPAPTLSRHGLHAYAQHPLLRTVSLDRSFYRPLPASGFAALAAQVPADFRFVVKVPAVVTDASLRDGENGRPLGLNPAFLDPAAACASALEPAAAGLADALGVLVFQLSPLPARWLQDPDALHQRLEALWAAVVPGLPAGSLAALEVRDPALLTPRLAAQLKAHGVRYALGLHDRMPPVEEQLDMLRATWPGDFVCRWNLQRGLGYEQAKGLWEPFDRLQAVDPATRRVLAKVVRATLDAGHRAFVTINNKAEGSAPLSVVELARALVA